MDMHTEILKCQDRIETNTSTKHLPFIAGCCGDVDLSNRYTSTRRFAVDGSDIPHQLRLVDYPINYKV